MDYLIEVRKLNLELIYKNENSLPFERATEWKWKNAKK